jgi:ribosomal protein S18 acetylase RimI-like enzyme
MSGVPPAITLRPMTEPELTARLAGVIDQYAHDIQRAGRASAEQAHETAERQTEQLLPDGVDSPDTLVYTAEDGAGRPVGWLWLSLPSEANGRDAAWVYEIAVDPGERGKGYGRAIMRAAEDELVRRGVARLALNVFTDNPVAVRLYESLGFQVMAQQMAKPLNPPA